MVRWRAASALGAALLLAASASAALASSHREAPLISLDPSADNTDLYAFVSPDNKDRVTIIANYIPLEEPAGGPNFFTFDPRVLYEIHVDNNGDARPDITYQFRFRTTYRTKATFLYNTGPVTSLTDPDWNVRQFYSVTKVENGDSDRLGTNLPTPPDNVGPRSTPNYATTAASAVRSIDDGIKVFAGQRDDTFWVDLGSIFDLGGLRPFNPAHLLPLPAKRGVDGVGGYNTHAIAMQIPITELTADGKKHGADDPKAVLGIYASSSRQATTVLNSNGTTSQSGAWRQVSRLGNPLINEVIIPLADKDLWNARRPAGDSAFAKYYTSPELARLINVLYPPLEDIDETGRADLVAVLLTGVPGLNFTGKTQADLLRLNTGIPPCTADRADDDAGECRRLAVLEGDFAGFPNGRRLTDDVTDIELRAIAQGYGPILASALGLPNKSPNNQIGDGVNANDRTNLRSFPYQATPHQGYEHVHHKLGPTLL